jgi:hypothetical protein
VADDLEAAIVKVYGHMEDTARHIQKIATEVGLLSRAVSFLGMAMAVNPSTPPGAIEGLLEDVLEGYDEEALQRADRTVQNLRLLWRTPK